MNRLTNIPSEPQHSSQPAKRRRALLASNPLRNSRSKTHRNDEGAAALVAPLLHRCDRSSMPPKTQSHHGADVPFTVPFVKIFTAYGQRGRGSRTQAVGLGCGGPPLLILTNGTPNQKAQDIGACHLSRWQILTSWHASACHMSISSGLVSVAVTPAPPVSTKNAGHVQPKGEGTWSLHICAEILLVLWSFRLSSRLGIDFAAQST
jgi:hypothetical protein